MALHPQMKMGSSSGEGRPQWSVLDNVKRISGTSPETLMAEINTGITNIELARATALLESVARATARPTPPPQYDVRMADEAYRAGCAALAAGQLDEALHSLTISLSKCPPDKTSAVAKLQSLISLTSQQLQRPSNSN
ncbi:hypothetical protein CFOL_v3_32064 [Cephalotus follicularis]|uniref:Uncharacterized protein n=1 Tax=Cephalotus follicularis TaxID=3775 RepID=A0A1Q3D856_CEPFO|nr:hypothetical protein CFOL_v3_32064 [Cephalotus follicularis]